MCNMKIEESVYFVTIVKYSFNKSLHDNENEQMDAVHLNFKKLKRVFC